MPFLSLSRYLSLQNIPFFSIERNTPEINATFKDIKLNIQQPTDEVMSRTETYTLSLY